MRIKNTKFLVLALGLILTSYGLAQDKIPTEEEFFEIIRSQGISKAVEIFNSVRKTHPDKKIFREPAMNRVGYEFLFDEKVEEAIEIFKLNVADYPDAYNTYNSLGESYMIHGNTEQAIKNYNKSVELDPENENAKGIAYSLTN